MTFAREVRHFRVSYPKGGVRSKAKEQKRFFFSFQKSQQPKIHAANQKQHTNKQNATYE